MKLKHMLKTLLRHVILEHCINVVFSRITANFSLPPVETDWLSGGIVYHSSNDQDDVIFARFDAAERRLYYSDETKFIQYEYDDFDSLKGLDPDDMIDSLSDMMDDDLNDLLEEATGKNPRNNSPYKLYV